MNRLQKWIIPVVVLCFAVILVLLTTDLMTKHFLYLQQRDIMYDLIRDDGEYEKLKSTVAYLQGTATRRLTQIKETVIIFGLSFLVLFILVKGVKGQ